jgi:3-keto-5-aminohexanoate cleavage enzyme
VVPGAAVVTVGLVRAFPLVHPARANTASAAHAAVRGGRGTAPSCRPCLAPRVHPGPTFRWRWGSAGAALPPSAPRWRTVTGEPVVIEVALNELVDKTSNPHVPYGPEEVARDARVCVDAGVTLLHFHARHPGSGAQRWHDDGLYREAIERLRRLGAPPDLPWYPTYPGVRPGVPVSESMAHLIPLSDPQAGLRLAAIDLGSFNLSPYNPATRQFVSPSSVKVLPHTRFEEFSGFCRDHGLRPYLGVYEMGHLRHLAAYLDLGWIDPPLIIKFFFSEFHPYGLPPAPRSLEMQVELMDTVLAGVERVWFVQCYGPGIWDLAAAALDLGGHLRVGLGDLHPWEWPDPGAAQPTNAELVERAAAMAGASGRGVATVADARARLRLDATVVRDRDPGAGPGFGRGPGPGLG